MVDEKSRQRREAEEKSAPEGRVVYEAIRQEGESELERQTAALAWSGLAAGLSMGFSCIGKAVLRDHLPEARPDRGGPRQHAILGHLQFAAKGEAIGV